MISRVDKESNPAAIGVLTTQIISMDPLFWSTDLGSKSTVEEALISMLSDTRRNPNPQQGIRYTPRTYAFEAAFQPKTLSTKCHYGFNEESAAMSATYFQFAVGNMQEFDNVIATILDDPTSLPLLEYMKAAIDEGIFESPTNNSTLVMLTKNPSTASDVDFLLCFSKYREEQRTMGLVCTYILTSVIVVSPQAVDPAIAANLNRGSEPRDYINATQHFTITIHHNLQNSGQDEGKKPSPLFSSAQLIKATADATRYLASLGHNVYIYKDQDSQTDQLYILFDTVELKDGYEISSAAFVAICALTALFLLIFAISEKFFSTVYNSTLYKTIYKEINTKIESVPMLLHYTRDPLAFDDHQVIYSSGEHLNVISETQGHPMASLKHRNSVPMPDHQQDLHSPDVTTVHHSRLSSLSITSTQFASPVTTN
ncbi:hypothetical protein BGW42_003675 [Actinomortierella wolfii]|nr:hypothetical protein BGW42_003675 [Actinomortierella wolfii]